MGKKGGGGFNVFESYIAAGLSSQSTTSAGKNNNIGMFLSFVLTSLFFCRQ